MLRERGTITQPGHASSWYQYGSEQAGVAYSSKQARNASKTSQSQIRKAVAAHLGHDTPLAGVLGALLGDERPRAQQFQDVDGPCTLHLQRGEGTGRPFRQGYRGSGPFSCTSLMRDTQWWAGAVTSSLSAAGRIWHAVCIIQLGQDSLMASDQVQQRVSWQYPSLCRWHLVAVVVSADECAGSSAFQVIITPCSTQPGFCLP